MGLFNRSEKWENFSGNINIYENLKYSDIPLLVKEERIHSIQFYMFKNPSRKTWEVLNEFYQQNPELGLHIFWYDIVDFSFLDLIPSIKILSISSYLTIDFTPLLKIPNLKKLSIGETKSTHVDLSFISEFKNLESLYIDGMKKGLDSISNLSLLKILTLRGIKLSSLDLIIGLKNLRELNLLFGSYKNLDAISTLVNLETLEISRTRQIPNFDFLDFLTNLTSLSFEGMSKMETLPNLRGLKDLRKIMIDNNSRLIDISAIEQLKNLEQLVLFFPENFKADFRKTLMIQYLEILLSSESIKYATLINLMDEQTKQKLSLKGIKTWNFSNSKLEDV